MVKVNVHFLNAFSFSKCLLRPFKPGIYLLNLVMHNYIISCFFNVAIQHCVFPAQIQDFDPILGHGPPVDDLKHIPLSALQTWLVALPDIPLYCVCLSTFSRQFSSPLILADAQPFSSIGSQSYFGLLAKIDSVVFFIFYSDYIVLEQRMLQADKGQVQHRIIERFIMNVSAALTAGVSLPQQGRE